MKKRGLEAIDVRFSDTNGDGTLELVTLASHAIQGKRFFVLSVLDFDDALRPILRFERRTPAPRIDPAHYRPEIAALARGFESCESWSIASWTLRECHHLTFDETWAPRVSAYTVTTREPRSHASQTNAFDFDAREAMRAYSQLPEGAFMPAIQRQARYALIVAPQDDTLPGLTALDTPYLAEFRPNHEPIAYQVRWNDAGLYLSLNLRDADPVVPQACSDPMDIQFHDHVEIWLDLNPALQIQRDAPQSWLADYESAYRAMPFRHDIDADVMAFAVTPNACLVPITPTRQNWRVLPQTQAARTQDGYRVDIFLPAELFNTRLMSQLANALGIGFTARQHDVHADASFSDQATSDWTWPDPFTFGQIWLLPDSASQNPPFPLQWDAWFSGR